MSLSDLTDSVLPKPQLPVPIFLPVTLGDPDPTVKSTKERGRRERNLKSEMQKTQGEKSDGVGTKDGQRQESDAPNGESLDEREVKI